jgi:hypothetical protein
MIVIFHRGHLGFQPNAVSSDVHYSFTSTSIDAFIADGLLYIPVSDDDLDAAELGTNGNIAGCYKVSSQLYSRYLHWDKTGPTDNIIQKSKRDAEGGMPQMRRIPLNLRHNTTAVLSANAIDAEYLTALVHADGTFDQINDFVQEYNIGSARRFIWTQISVVADLIRLSNEVKAEFPYQEVRFGPSKWLDLQTYVKGV